MDDRQLVKRLLARDPEAERIFFHTYRVKLYKVSVYILGYQDPEAEDVTQDAFLTALRKLPEFEFRSSLYTWLYRICVHLCYDRIDKRQRQVAQLEQELETLAGSLSVGRKEQEEEESEKAHKNKLLMSQLGKLGEPCRGLLDLRDFQGESYAGISEKLKIPMGTVMSRLARCRETLKRLVLEAFKG